MGRRNAAPLDDNDHRRGGRHWGRLKHKRSTIRLGMRCCSGKILVVRVAQGRHMVANHQDKFIPQLGQGTALHPMAGTAQQRQWIIGRALVSMLGPFVRTQAH